MKKAQAAVPIMLIMFLGMFIFYILWAQPSHVVDVLNLTEGEPGKNVTEAEEGKRVVFRRSQVGTIGRATAGIIGEHTIGSLNISYPQVTETVKNESQVSLTSSILNSPSYITNLNKGEGELALEFSGNSEGHPLLEVYFNDTRQYSNTLEETERHYQVSLGKAIPGDLEITCKWQGLIPWSKQKCILNNLLLKRSYYDDTEAEEAMNFQISNSEFRKTNNLRVLFGVENKVGEGKLIGEVNNHTVYRGNPDPRQASYSAMVNSQNIDLIAGENTISFSAEEGSNYSLTNIKTVTYEKKAEEVEKTMEFYLPSNITENATGYKLLVDIEEVKISGSLSLDLPLKTYESSEELSKGWNSFFIEGKAIREGRNTLTLKSPSEVGGRFEIGTVILKWVK